MMLSKDKDRRATVTDSSKSAPVAALHEVITRNHLGYETVHRVMAVSEADAHAQVEQSVTSSHVPATQVVNVTRTS